MTPRIYKGESDTGERFAMLFGQGGIRWLWGDDAQQFFRAPHPSGPSPSGNVAASLDAASGVIGSAAQAVHALGVVLQWWELRKAVQVQGALFEEERRIPWTYDLISRWVVAHSDGKHLDLELSHFLAREAVATLRAIVESPKMAVPQAMLYDLEQIRAVIGATRVMLGNQFRALQRAENFNVSGVVAKAIGRPDGEATLNFSWIARWAQDPRTAWDSAIAQKTSKDFEDELSEMARHPETVLARAFGYTQAESPKPKKDNKDTPNLLLLAALGAVPELRVVVSVGAGVALLASQLLDKRDVAKDLRRDDFRELALFAAEVERTRLLHRLWCAVDAMTRKVRSGGLLVEEMNGRVQLSAPTGSKGEYAVIAMDDDRVVGA